MRIVVKEKLIKACIKGERKAQQSLYQSCFQPLLSICMRYKNNKEDGVATRAIIAWLAPSNHLKHMRQAAASLQPHPQWNRAHTRAR